MSFRPTHTKQPGLLDLNRILQIGVNHDKETILKDLRNDAFMMAEVIYTRADGPAFIAPLLHNQRSDSVKQLNVLEHDLTASLKDNNNDRERTWEGYWNQTPTHIRDVKDEPVWDVVFWQLSDIGNFDYKAMVLRRAVYHMFAFSEHTDGNPTLLFTVASCADRLGTAELHLFMAEGLVDWLRLFHSNHFVEIRTAAYEKAEKQNPHVAKQWEEWPSMVLGTDFIKLALREIHTAAHKMAMKIYDPNSTFDAKAHQVIDELYDKHFNSERQRVQIEQPYLLRTRGMKLHKKYPTYVEKCQMLGKDKMAPWYRY